MGRRRRHDGLSGRTRCAIRCRRPTRRRVSLSGLSLVSLWSLSLVCLSRLSSQLERRTGRYSYASTAGASGLGLRILRRCESPGARERRGFAWDTDPLVSKSVHTRHTEGGDTRVCIPVESERPAGHPNHVGFCFIWHSYLHPEPFSKKSPRRGPFKTTLRVEFPI